MEQVTFDLERYRREAADPDFTDGIKALNEERYEEARTLLERAYQNGNVMAGVLFGETYYAGTGVEFDFEKAIPFFWEGIEKGCPVGLPWLAECYNSGWGTPKDEKKAQELCDAGRAALREMALAGSADAMFVYGYNLVMDRFPDRKLSKEEIPYEEGFRFLEQAMNRGIVSAGVALASAYLCGNNCEQDLEKALAILDGYDGMKNKNLNFWQGYTYYFGEGREQDFGKAKKYLLLAAERGDDFAMAILGDMYSGGEGVEQDLSQAIEWYEKADKLDNPCAQKELANLYYCGEGVLQDTEKAAEYFQKSADGGFMDSAYKLACIRIFDEGYQDRETGFRYLEMAARQDNLAAQRLLARCYRGKYGFEKDAEKAEYWSLKAESQEDVDSFGE